MADTSVPPPVRIGSNLSTSTSSALSPTSPSVKRTQTSASVVFQQTLALRRANRADRRRREEEIRSEVHNLLRENATGRIDNPLHHLTDAELDDRVIARRKRWGFTKRAEFGDLKLWLKAIKCAADPEHCIYSVKDLTESERRVLRKENDPRLGFWDETHVRVPIALCCLAAMVQGFTQSAANAANLYYPVALGMQSSDGVWVGSHNGRAMRWLFNCQNAAPLLVGALFGCWLSDPLNEFVYGRRGAIFIAGILTLISVVGAAFAENKFVFLAFRILLGLGMGSKASVVPIYAAEVSPPRLRGRLVVNWQIFDAFGIALSFTLNMIFARDAASGWRLMFAEGILPTLPLLALVCAVPESPRFLMKRGLYDEAYRALLRLRGSPIRAAKEMLYLDAQLEAAEAQLMSKRRKQKIIDEEVKEMSKQRKWTVSPDFDDEDDDEFEDLIEPDAEKSTKDIFDPDKDEPDTDPIGLFARLHAWWKRLWSGGGPAPGQTDPFFELFRETTYWTRIKNLVGHPRVARATLAAAIVMISQQACGINILAFYSSTLFLPPSSANDPISTQDKYDALYYSWGFGMTNFIFSIFAYYLVDTKGRRWLLLWTFPFMAVLLLLAGFTYAPVPGLSYAFIIVYTMIYSIGAGPVPFTYSAEVFPLGNREAGMSFSVFINFFFAGLLQLLVPQLIPNPRTLLGIFAALCVISFIFIFFFVRETKERTLEEINYIFGVRNLKHMNYQLTAVAPYKIRLYRWRLTAWRMSKEEREATRPTAPPALYTWSSRRGEDVTNGRGNK